VPGPLAAADARQVLVATGGGQLFLLRVAAGALVPVAARRMDTEARPAWERGVFCAAVV
jgi:hypothetical protein